jgi:hypothetical protein
MSVRWSLDICRQCWPVKFPSLHHRKEGWLRHKENVAQPPKRTQPGWFTFWFAIGKPPRPLLKLRAGALALRDEQKDASRYFLTRAATPPCGDARRGIGFSCNDTHASYSPESAR